MMRSLIVGWPDSLFRPPQAESLQRMDTPSVTSPAPEWMPSASPPSSQSPGPLGITRWAYDPLNRVVAVTDSLGRTLRY
ncbi:MAG: RHS repeat protein, partial [Anaerolineae bacterium]|nr:RHS repeat protein [Anaerolineae bacterium]